MTMTDPNAAEPLLDVRELRTWFEMAQGPARAVNDVTFAVYAGRIVGLVGESGSGKSVTARSVLRMIDPPGRILHGEVRYRGTDLLTLSEMSMRRLRGSEIAMVFQEPQSALNPVMRVGDQIAEAAVVHGTPKRAARARAQELLTRVGIPDARHRFEDYPHQFSGGMQQRVVVAVALANRPSLLVADEPTTALDVTVQAEILRLLGELRDELGLSVLLITHDMGVVAEMCDDLVVMYGGRVMERGPVEVIFSRSELPYTVDLLAAMPRVDERTAERLASIPGAPPDPIELPPGCPFHPRCRFGEDICGREVPPLTMRGDGHAAACHVTQRGTKLDLAAIQSGLARQRERKSTPLLEISDLRVDVASGRRGLFRPRGPIHAVDGVDLAVHRGETVGLVGESGCGKSTLARTIVGINRIASGSVRIAASSEEPSESPGNGGPSGVQYVFQDPSASLNPRRTVRQALDEALAVRGAPREGRRTELVRLLDRVGLGEQHLDRYPRALSGGQRQRVGIARALATEPELLVLDEPVSALDVSIQAQIINLLESLRDESGLGYLFIAHDLSVVRHLSDRVAVMYLGRLVEVGDAEAIYGSPQHPYTAALLASSPVPDPSARGRERIVLGGELPSPASPPSGCRFRTRCPIGPLRHPERQRCVDEDPVPAPAGPGGQLTACHFAGELQNSGVAG